MFGGKYGAFRTQNRSFFNQENHIYKEIKNMISLRNSELALQVGRQYLRENAFPNQEFNLIDCNMQAGCLDIVSWSRIFNREEILLAINSNLNKEREVKVMVDSDLHLPGEEFTCIYSSDSDQIDTKAKIIELNPEYYYIKILVPAQGRVIYKL